MTELENISDVIMSLNENDVNMKYHVILYENNMNINNIGNNMNISILTATIQFIKDSINLFFNYY